MQGTRGIGLMLALALAAGAQPGAAQQQQNDVLAKLQRARAANPSSVAVNRALGIWYYKAGHFSEARTPLDEARRLIRRTG